MKKVLIISSSPRRKGNSEMLCEQFKQGALDAGHEVEMINLNNYQIAPCIACDYCRKHDHVCFRKDDANTVIQKMIDADIWVLSSPVYFYSITAQMKLLIDRFFAREYEVRNENNHREAYLLVTSGAPDLSKHTGAIESLRGFIQVLGVKEAGIINGAGAFNKGDAINHPSYIQAYELGKQIQ